MFLVLYVKFSVIADSLNVVVTKELHTRMYLDLKAICVRLSVGTALVCSGR
jgi:hypothetical protein